MKISIIKITRNLHANFLKKNNKCFPNHLYSDRGQCKRMEICLSRITFPRMYYSVIKIQLSNSCCAFFPLVLCSWSWNSQQSGTEYCNIPGTKWKSGFVQWIARKGSLKAKWKLMKEGTSAYIFSPLTLPNKSYPHVRGLEIVFCRKVKSS